MKKQFKFPVAVVNWTDETVKFMEGLGYEKAKGSTVSYSLLVNNYNGNFGKFSSSEVDSLRTLCDWHTEPELCKALLAATEGDIIYQHEYIKSSDRNSFIDNKSLTEMVGCNGYKKPTLEELLNHFRGKKEVKEERKVIGRIVPFDVPCYYWKKGDVIYPKKLEGKLYYSLNNYCTAKEIAEQWEPVYEKTLEDKLGEILMEYDVELPREKAIEQIKKLFGK